MSAAAHGRGPRALRLPPPARRAPPPGRRRWRALLLALLSGCAKPGAAPDAGDAWQDLRALVTSFDMHEATEAARRLRRDLGAEPPATAPPEAQAPEPLALPASPNPPDLAAPADGGGAPGRPAAAQAAGEPAPTGEPTPPPCNGWTICNSLVLAGPTVPVLRRAQRPPRPQGGVPVAGIYELTDVTVYTGFFGEDGPRGDVRRSTIAIPEVRGTQVVAQEVLLANACADSSTVALEFAGTRATSTVLCSSSPCRDDCGGAFGYTATGGAAPALQLAFQAGEVDTFRWRRPPR